MKAPERHATRTTALLPVGSPASVRRYLLLLARRHRGGFGTAVGLHAVGAAAGLVGPWVLGEVVQSLSTGSTDAYITRAVLFYLAALLVQSVFTGLSRLRGGILGEEI